MPRAARGPVCIWGVVSIVVGCGRGALEDPSKVVRPVVVHSADSVRRVCLQMGLGSPGTGGGSIVFLTGHEGGGLGLDTLHGDHVVTSATNPVCGVTEQRLRVCPADRQRTPDVPVEEALAAGAKSVGRLVRGTPLAFYEYVSGGGVTKAVVNVDGKARFISADEVCHADGVAATSRATDKFAMNVSVKGGPKSYRPRSTEAIKRIVIHNTEVPLKETLHHFGRTEANTSAHVVIDKDGAKYRVIEDQFSAFHAGASKDGFGGYNSTSLGIEVVAFSDSKYGGDPLETGFFTDAQRASVIELVDFWLAEYKLTIDPDVLANRAKTEGYADLEYRKAALTIHRLTKADRGTDCPRLLFPSSPEGDEEFFRWRDETFGVTARRKSSP
jgi:hypothetical protein